MGRRNGRASSVKLSGELGFSTLFNSSRIVSNPRQKGPEIYTANISVTDITARCFVVPKWRIKFGAGSPEHQKREHGTSRDSTPIQFITCHHLPSQDMFFTASTYIECQVKGPWPISSTLRIILIAVYLSTANILGSPTSATAD